MPPRNATVGVEQPIPSSYMSITRSIASTPGVFFPMIGERAPREK
jgi:hypothetical protein